MTTNATILKYEPGDTLVFFAPIDASQFELEKASDLLRRKFPDANVLVLGGITDVKVVRGNHD